jgi:multiple sugar transport system ATP-binding protein
MAGVELAGIQKIYDEGGQRHVAVSDFNLEIADGEFVVLVGPSGCGKSTTLRMIAGLESISAGELRINRRLVNQVPAKERDIAMVFQNYALYPHMTAYDNMAFALELRKLPRQEIERRVRDAAGILAIEPLLEKRPRQMSGGERQRVALGRALVRHPQVFLFDEPLSNLDAKLRVQMRREIARLHQQLGTTMIYVTHDQVEAMTLGDRIVVMNRGVVQQVDAPSAIYQRPINTFVASFIGTPPMNLIEGKLKGGNSPTFRPSGAEFELRLDSGAIHRPRDGESHPVVLGIRPEDLTVRQLEASGRSDNVIPAKVELVELLGAEAVIHLSSGQVELTARMPAPFSTHAGEVGVSVPADRVHLFNGGTGQRLN